MLNADSNAYPEYFWMVVLSIIFGFVMAFAIGANDGANSWGSSVASKALTLGQAVVVAFFCEFLGAMILGQSVTNISRNAVLHQSFYADQPVILMYGLLNSLIVASFWLMIANALEFPVSTTHTLLSAIIGFSIAAEGFESVNVQRTLNIVISWFAAPCLAGFVAFIFFSFIKYFVYSGTLRSEESFARALYVYPVVIFCGITVNVAFIVLQAEKRVEENRDIPNYGKRIALPSALGAGALAVVMTVLFVNPYLRDRVLRDYAEIERERENEEYRRNRKKTSNKKPVTSTTEARNDSLYVDSDSDSDSSDDDSDEDDNTENGLDTDDGSHDASQTTENDVLSKSWIGKAWDAFANRTFRQDLQAQSFAQSKRTQEIWESSETHDDRTELLFSYLQIFSACLASFAHGSNDVTNAINPVATIIHIQIYGKNSPNSTVDKWLLAMGGAGIGIGFALYGYNMMRALGYKLTCITPSRGCCIELATALSVSVASYLKVPVSTTQCLVGATVGVGLASGGVKNVNWLFLLRTVLGWAGIFLISCLCSSGLFAYCIYSPSVVQVVF